MSSSPREGGRAHGAPRTQALVTAPICPLMSAPTLQCERADEALAGWPVEVLECPCPGWRRIRTHYGYTGYAPADCLAEGEMCIRDRIPDLAVVDLLYTGIIQSDYERFSRNLDKSGMVIADRGYSSR